MRTLQQRSRRATALAVLAAAVGPVVRADVSTNTSGQPTQNSAGNAAVTISLSGSTAMRNFTTSQGITFLNPGSSIVINDGVGGAPVTYTAPNIPNESFQLASGSFVSADQPVGGPFPSTNTTQVHSALRLEWHEQGSVEGILELSNDQIGYLNNTPLIDPTTRNASAGNPIWVNRNKYTTPSAGSGVGLPIAPSDYNNYSTATYDSSGRNLQGGMNRVQIGIGDMKAIQGFAIGGGTAGGSFMLTPTVTGYGKGNNTTGRIGSPLTLPTNGPAVAGSFYQLHDQSALNMEKSKIDPATGAAYATGAWNTAGIENLQSTTVAMTATVFAANPGTGLDKVNRTDGQWLLTSGRLANGASFNMTTRDVGSGTHNVMANNVGVDPSWSVGVNDAGNGNDLTPGDTAQDQLNIGSAMKFSNKTAGGGQLRPTVQNNRMAIGELGLSDAISAVSNGGGNKPLRALSYSDSTNGATPYVTVSAASITDGSYAIWQQEQYVTVKAPNTAFAGDTAAQWAARTDAETGVKGDNTGSNVAAFRKNILVSTSLFPNTNSVANAGDQLLATSFILPQMMQVTKPMDGVGLTTSNGTNYNAGLRTALLTSSYAANFNADDPASITKGSGSTYGNAGNNTASFKGQINITDQNYLFGNFNQNGTRDFAALMTAQQAQADLAASGFGTAVFSGSLNASVVTFHGAAAGLSTMANQAGSTGATKGDLIVMGDFNGDGKFDGKDLYAFATGAALADNTNTTSLTVSTTLGDALRSGVLRKNAALDWMQTNATPQQKADAAVTSSANPRFTTAIAQANAFSRFDVNGDGVVDLIDAAVVDKFVGQDPTNINHQLSATVTAGATNAADIANLTKPQVPINLYTVKQIDGGAPVSHALVNGDSDFHQMYANLNRNNGGSGQGSNAVLLDGDTTFKGSVGLSDYNTLAANFNKPGKWSQGDSDFDGTVGLSDYNLLAANFNKSGDPRSGAVAAAKAAGVKLTSGSASPAGQSVLPAGVVDPGAGKVALEADPSTGKVYIVGHDSNINSYEVDSAGGKLTFVSGKNPGGYNTLTAQSTVDFIPGSNNPSEGTWAVLSSQSGTFVAEVYPASASPAFDIIGPGLQVFDLNKSGLSAWTAGTPISDLTFKYGNGTGATLTPAVIEVPEPTTLLVLAVGAAALLGRRRRKQK